jgi:hypothetical protein
LHLYQPTTNINNKIVFTVKYVHNGDLIRIGTSLDSNPDIVNIHNIYKRQTDMMNLDSQQNESTRHKEVFGIKRHIMSY